MSSMTAARPALPLKITLPAGFYFDLLDAMKRPKSVAYLMATWSPGWRDLRTLNPGVFSAAGPFRAKPSIMPVFGFTDTRESVVDLDDFPDNDPGCLARHLFDGDDFLIVAVGLVFNVHAIDREDVALDQGLLVSAGTEEEFGGFFIIIQLYENVIILEVGHQPADGSVGFFVRILRVSADDSGQN